MKRAGGGWTLGIKHWYQSGLQSAGASAKGTVDDALKRKGTPYKLSDEHIRAIIGSERKFDMLMDQSGNNSAYSSGNYEYVVVRGYTADWKWDGNVAASETTTEFTSYRRDDDAVVATFNLLCGPDGEAGANGVNCFKVADGSINPSGGSGCIKNMGSSSNVGWHTFTMGRDNSDTYLYVCNGAQHSSSHNMNHRVWFRPSLPSPL